MNWRSLLTLASNIGMVVIHHFFWSTVFSHLIQKKHTFFSHILVNCVFMQESSTTHPFKGKMSSLEHVLALMVSHVGQNPCICANIDPRWNYTSQILTVPFLWKCFPYLKEVCYSLFLSSWDIIASLLSIIASVLFTYA